MTTTSKIAQGAESICTGHSSIMRNWQPCGNPINCHQVPIRPRSWSRPAKKLTTAQPLTGCAKQSRNLALRVRGKKSARFPSKHAKANKEAFRLCDWYERLLASNYFY